MLVFIISSKCNNKQNLSAISHSPAGYSWLFHWYPSKLHIFHYCMDCNKALFEFRVSPLLFIITLLKEIKYIFSQHILHNEIEVSSTIEERKPNGKMEVIV